LRHRRRRQDTGHLPGSGLFFLVLAALSALTLAACGSRGETASTASHFISAAAGIRVDLTVRPFPPSPMEKASFEIIISDGDGGPVSGATIRCEMTMPGMAMPMNRPPVTESHPGAYSAEVVFTMAGRWQAALDVRLPDGRTGAFLFPISTK
jgi:hypothetical protein